MQQNNIFKLTISYRSFCSKIIVATLLLLLSINSSWANLPNCEGSLNPNPGTNCLINDLPLCESTAGTSQTVYNGSDPTPRENCMNVIHLPLCSELDPSEQKVKANCINKCATNAHADHNKECIRFCDSSTNTDNCVIPKCHQLDNGITPEPISNDQSQKNCDMENCKYLFTEELNNSKFDADDKKYCEGGTNYCYEFEEDQLQYLHARPNNTMCQLHKCKPKTFFCGRDFSYDPNNKTSDQTLAIKAKGAAFVENYERYIINAGANDGASNDVDIAGTIAGTIDETTRCKISICQPALIKPIHCGASDTNPDCTAPTATCNADNKCLKATIECFAAVDFNQNLPDQNVTASDECLLSCQTDGTPHADCNYQGACSETEVEGESYPNHKYCNRIVDCNSNPVECSVTETSSDDYQDPQSNPDTSESWFYRPSPHKKSFKNNDIPEADPGDHNAYKGQYRPMDFTAQETNSEHNSTICYSKDHMKDNNNNNNNDDDDDDYNNFGRDVPLLGYWHSYVGGDDTRVPQACTTRSSKMHGSRAVNYEGLCGVVTVFEKVDESDQTAYFKNHVQTSYDESDSHNNTKHTINICTRFNNSMILDRSCGRRECGISYAFGDLTGNVCGYDVCKTMVVKDQDPKECIVKNDYEGGDNFTTSKLSSKGCADGIDRDIRVRAVKYGRYICAFLDTKDKSAIGGGVFLTNSDSDNIKQVDISRNPNLKYCMTGDGNKEIATDGSLEDKCPNAFNVSKAEDVWQTLLWRPFLQIPYIDKSYYQHDSDLLMREQMCAKTELKAEPQRAHRRATINNSPHLFLPPLYISKIFAKKGSNQEVLATNEGEIGATDFFMPKIEISLGDEPDNPDTKAIIELDINQEVTLSGQNANVSIPFMDGTFSASVYIKKVFNYANQQPILCAYRDLGEGLEPIRIGCIPRLRPEIGDILANEAIVEDAAINTCSNTQSFLNNEKIIVAEKSGNSFRESFIRVQLQNEDGCRTKVVDIKTPDNLDPVCNTSQEQYQICAKREECSQLNIERVENEIAIFEAYIMNEPVAELMEKRDYYNDFLSPKCQEKEGLLKEGSSVADYSADAYGWFNEICITKGFEKKLDSVIAKKVANGALLGECIIDNDSSTPNIDNNFCSDGGNPRLGCYCKKAELSTSPAFDEVLRQQTPREAGLCIDIPEPALCPTISYVDTTESGYNPADPFYAESSLDKYDNDVHKSHRDRTVELNYGHAEFQMAFEGSRQMGTCNGFWQTDRSKGPPIMNCGNNGVWDSTASISLINRCIRYECNAVETGGNPADNGEYPNIIFDRNEAGEDRGSRFGYATWPEQQSDDEPVVITADQCITGFKPINTGYKIANQNNTINDDSSPNIDSLIQKSLDQDLSGDYTDLGTLPTMKCNQLGNHTSLKDSCERIRCYFKDPPSNPSNTSDFTKWYENGGAVFTPTRILQDNHDINNGTVGGIDQKVSTDQIENSNFDYNVDYGYGMASRSSSQIQKESKIIGECVNNLGFFQVQKDPPYRKCDHDGNLGPVQNKCATQCQEVIDNNQQKTTITQTTIDDDDIGGFALWPETNALDQSIEVSSTSCASGYIKYPYSPIRDKMGRWYQATYNGQTITPRHANGSTNISPNASIKLDLSDNRALVTKPSRNCSPVIKTDDAGNQKIAASVWTQPDTDCINKCPSYAQDSRIGVGATLHPFDSNNGNFSDDFIDIDSFIEINSSLYGNNKVLVQWPHGTFGSWSHIEYLDDHKTTDYGADRRNNKFSLSRYCNNNGTWGPPIVNCIANGAILAESTDNVKLNIDKNNNIQYHNEIGDNVSGGRVPSEEVNSSAIPGDVEVLIDGQCKDSNHYPENADNLANGRGRIELFAIKQYKCQPLNNYNYINQFYFKHEKYQLTSTQQENKEEDYYNNSCTMKCTAPAVGPIDGRNAKVEEGFDVNKIYNNEEIFDNLACETGFGNKVIGGSRSVSGVEHDCGRTGTTDRSPTEPNLICDTTGSEPEWVLHNNCSDCRGCNLNSSFNGTNKGQNFNASDFFKERSTSCDNESCYGGNCSLGISSSSVSHGSKGGPVCRYYHYHCNKNASRSNEYRCYTHAIFSYHCVDGISNISWSTMGDNELACDRDNYDFHTKREECHSGKEYMGGR